MTDDVNTDVLEETPVADNVETIGEEVPEKEERMYDNKTVSLIVERERKKAAEKAYEKGKREALMELQAQQQSPQQGQEAPTQQQQGGQQQSLGGMPQMNQEQMRQMMQQEMPQHLEHYINQVKNDQQVESFVSKMRAAEEKYPGLEEKLNKYDYAHGNGMTDLVLAANNLENTADIMKEITDNPHKMANLLVLAKQQPFAMQDAMQKLSGSIKQNQDASAQEAQSKDPMSRLKPSANAGADNGAMSVQDYRKMFSR